MYYSIDSSNYQYKLALKRHATNWAFSIQIGHKRWIWYFRRRT